MIADYRTVDEVARALGISHNLIYYHERRGFIAAPERARGARLYTPEQVEVLRAYFAQPRKRGRPPKK